MPKSRISLIMTVSIATLFLIGVSLHQPAKQPSTSDKTNPQLINTRPIDPSNSTGAVAKPTSEVSAPVPVPTPKPVEESSAEKYAKAPKQQAIAQSVEQEIIYKALKTSNDPLNDRSWYFTPLKIPQAWDKSTGSQEVVVAIIDTGFSLNHEDLKNQWLLNPNENGMTIPTDDCWTGISRNKTSNGCDDDKNGYIDDYRGWDFSNVDNLPQTGTTNPLGAATSHGTSVAGLAGAESNNGLGIASINWQTKLMPLQALSDDGLGSTSGISAAIYYAVDNGAQIINISLGASTNDRDVELAVNYAYSKGILIVAAAGNCGTGTESGCIPGQPGAMAYPALYDHVLSVGALMSNLKAASFSSYKSGVDVMAPGYGNLTAPMWTSSNSTNAYSQSLYGTSFAAPLVTSLASLIKSNYPLASVETLTEVISASSQKLTAMTNSFYSELYGHGLVDAELAVQASRMSSDGKMAPKLSQTGNNYSEHTFTAGQTMYSGCQASSVGYCTVWLRNQLTGQDRYLPYLATTANTPVGWTWPSELLTIGGGSQWTARASQGFAQSDTPYQLNSQK